ncbi:MAG: hypothetical protein H7235_02675, partial [Bdellovibrionaceae bacterium]|nr:hypothetical protein [Pseudobdellovibrionaceae bacterium]
MAETFNYDLFVEGSIVRDQIKNGPVDPITEARNLLTGAILGQVLLA